ncbi:MAG TPA: VWA domain-containing protein [Actinopolymorphaceae bacterium]
MPGRHAADSKRPRRGRGVLAVAGAVAVTLVAIFGVRSLSDPGRTAGPAECSGSLRIEIAAAPEVVPPLRTIAADVAKDKVSVAGECLSFDVQAVEPSEMFLQLSNPEPADDEPDLWIPDSWEWVDRTGIGSERILALSPSVAASPLVLATNQTTAEKLNRDKATDDWNELARAGKMVLADAETSGVALTSLLAVRRSILETVDGAVAPVAPEKARPAMGETILHLLTGGTAEDLDAELARAAEDGLDRGVPASEQQVFTLLQKDKQADVVPVMPKAGTVLFDYPLVAVVKNKKDSEKLIESGTALMQHVDTARGIKVLHEHGFRDFRDLETPKEITFPVAEKPQVLHPVGENDADDVLRSWAGMSLASRVLAVIDMSGSMAFFTPDGRKRIEIARDSAKTALSYFPPSTQFGLWTFSVDPVTGRDYEEVAPIKPLDDRHRADLNSELDDLPEEIQAHNTSINDTMLAAYNHAVDTYDAGKKNSVILITDGKDEDPNSISEKQLLGQLRAKRTEGKDVAVILVGIGSEADMDRLERIANAVDGTAVRAKDAQDMENIIIDSLLRRQCGPACS